MSPELFLYTDDTALSFIGSGVGELRRNCLQQFKKANDIV